MRFRNSSTHEKRLPFQQKIFASQIFRHSTGSEEVSGLLHSTLRRARELSKVRKLLLHHNVKKGLQRMVIGSSSAIPQTGEDVNRKEQIYTGYSSRRYRKIVIDRENKQMSVRSACLSFRMHSHRSHNRKSAQPSGGALSTVTETLCSACVIRNE